LKITSSFLCYYLNVLLSGIEGGNGH
jgi:hypothetical protein